MIMQYKRCDSRPLFVSSFESQGGRSDRLLILPLLLSSLRSITAPSLTSPDEGENDSPKQSCACFWTFKLSFKATLTPPASSTKAVQAILLSEVV